MVSATLDYTVDMDHDGRTYTVTVKGLRLLRCNRCGAKVIPDQSVQRLEDELRCQAKLLMPSEIARQRDRLGLSQKEFALLLGIAPATVCRWEAGGQIQQRAMNDFMNVFFNVPMAREFLRQLRGIRPATESSIPSNGVAMRSARSQGGHIIRLNQTNTLPALQEESIQAVAQ